MQFVDTKLQNAFLQTVLHYVKGQPSIWVLDIDNTALISVF